MILHFSTCYDNTFYKKIQPNKKYFGLLGLLQFLERELGLYDNYLSDEKRIILYSECLDKCKKDTFFEIALTNNKLKVAKQLLSYRDELIGFGWDFDLKDQPNRFKDFARVEAFFSKERKHQGINDRWKSLLKHIKTKKETVKEFNIDKIIVEDLKEYLPPLTQKILNLLASYAIKVEYAPLKLKDSNNNLNIFKEEIYNSIYDKANYNRVFNEKDNSLLLLNFKNEQLLNDALAQVANPNDNIFINHNNATFDYSLVSFGKPASGSEQVQAHPQATQIIKLIIPCFNGELNLNTLLSFLTLPHAPVPLKLRSKLAKSLAKTPGVENSSWKKIIAEFINSKAEQLSHIEQKERQKQVDLFLTFNTTEEKRVAKGKKILQYLYVWAQEKQKGKVIQELKEQFLFIENLCNEILNSFDFKNDDVKGLENMIKSFYDAKNFTNYKKQQKSVQVFKDVSSLALPVNETVYWLDFYEQQIYTIAEFLLKEEKVFLNEYAYFYNTQKQLKLHLYQCLRGLINCDKKLILCFIENKQQQKHQLHIRLESIFKNQYSKIVKTINTINDLNELLSFENKNCIDVTKINIPEAKDYFNSNTFQYISNREIESASSIEKFIHYPFDWAMQYTSKFSSSIGITLPNENLIKGNVAHKVIENLFEISNQFEFKRELIDKEFNNVINQEGAYYLQPENRFKLSEFKFRFLKSFSTLVNFIKVNNFKIESCEYSFGTNSDCVIDEALGKVRGAIDLYLIDSKGVPFIIDLKWTFSEKKYIEKIENNEAIQLALYAAAINKRDLSKTAYFMLNQNKIITAAKGLNGENIITIDTTDDNTIVLDKVKQSLEYRWSELKNGKLEMGEGHALNSLDYHKEKNIIKLPSEKKNKKENPYTGFKLFKGKLN